MLTVRPARWRILDSRYVCRVLLPGGSAPALGRHPADLKQLAALADVQPMPLESAHRRVLRLVYDINGQRDGLDFDWIEQAAGRLELPHRHDR